MKKRGEQNRAILHAGRKIIDRIAIEPAAGQHDNIGQVQFRLKSALEIEASGVGWARRIAHADGQQQANGGRQSGFDKQGCRAKPMQRPFAERWRDGRSERDKGGKAGHQNDQTLACDAALDIDQRHRHEQTDTDALDKARGERQWKRMPRRRKARHADGGQRNRQADRGEHAETGADGARQQRAGNRRDCKQRQQQAGRLQRMTGLFENYRQQGGVVVRYRKQEGGQRHKQIFPARGPIGKADRRGSGALLHQAFFSQPPF